MSRLEELRGILSQQEQNARVRQTSKPKFYPFWNLGDNSKCVIRLMPDGDTDNPLFWRQWFRHELRFQGIIPRPGFKIDPVVAQKQEIYVEIRSSYEEDIAGKVVCKTDPVSDLLNEMQLFDDESTIKEARQRWRKSNAVAQGLIVRSDMTEDETPSNPIRLLNIRSEILGKIRMGLLDDDPETKLPDLPTDPENGTDFIIHRVKRAGGHPDYSGSRFAPSTRALTDDELATLENYPLVDLGNYVPPAIPYDLAFEMTYESVIGAAYDPAKYHQAGLPYGVTQLPQ